MRPYRGKRIDNGEWVFGWYLKLHCCSDGKSYFMHIIDGGFDDDDRHEVHPNSVGQQTGRKDEDGKEIYGGDKLRESYGDTCIVYWKESTAGFHCKWRDGSDMPLDYGVAVNKCKIIGTIHDKEKK